jgi:hypothetical protein
MGRSRVAAMTDDDLPPHLTRLTFHGPLSAYLTLIPLS